MIDSRRRILIRAVAAGALPAVPLFAAAQAYPNKPITIKIAFPAGGPADASIRAASVVVERSLGQTLVQENVPGAGGALATMAVVRAPADGYTLLGTTGTDFFVAPMNVQAAKYEPEQFKLLGVIGVTDFVLVSSPAHSFKTIDELVAYTRRAGSKDLSIGHWGKGSAPHLVGADLQQRTGIRLLEVPYKGVAPVLTDLAGGQLDLAFVPLGGPPLGMIQKGQVRAVGIAAKARNPAVPDVPALSESPQLADFDHSIWTALFAPPATPEPVVARLNQAMNDWTASAENQERTKTWASRASAPMNPAQAVKFMAAEQAKVVKLARSLRLEAE